MVYDIFEHYKNYILPYMNIKVKNKYLPKRSQRIKNKRRRKSK